MALSNEQIEVIKTIIPDIEVTEDTTLEDIKNAAGERLISLELHKKEIDAVYGKARGSAETKFRRMLGEEGKGKNFDELTELMEQRFGNFSEQIKQLEKDVKSGKITSEEKEKLENELKQVRETLDLANAEKEALQMEVESARAEGETKVNQYILNTKINQAFAEANWVDTADKYVRTGIWKDEVEGKYTFKDEGGKLLVFDTSGNIVKDGTTQMTADKLFENILKQTGKYKVHSAAPVTHGTKALSNAKDSKTAAHFERLREHAAKMAGQ